MLWGPRDPVFTEDYLRDLLTRLPHADVQRYAGASHLVTEDAVSAVVDAWRWVVQLKAGVGFVGQHHPPELNSHHLWTPVFGAERTIRPWPWLSWAAMGYGSPRSRSWRNGSKLWRAA